MAQWTQNWDPGTHGRKSLAPCLEDGATSQHGFEFKLEILKAPAALVTHGWKSLTPCLENGTRIQRSFECELEILKAPRAPVV